MATGIYTGALVRITSGTGAAGEAVVLTQTSTSLTVATTLSTPPDSTSNYSIGDINAYYYTKWYDFGDAPRLKSFRGMYFWASENSSNEVNISYSEDYGSAMGSETKDLSPSGSSLWDTALWDSSVWGTTGDKFYNVKHTGRGRVIQVEFAQPSIDKSFNIYGFHLLADRLDRE